MTNSELNEFIATEIMGYVETTSTIPIYVSTEKIETPVAVEDYTPTTDRNQAFEALEKWVADPMREKERDYSISTLRWEGKEEIEVCLRVNAEYSTECDDDIAVIEHKSLPLAICLALREAKESNDE